MDPEKYCKDLSGSAHNKSIQHTIREIIQERDMAAKGSSFENIFYASDLSENFVNMIDSIFEGEDEDARVKFLNFDLEQGDKYEF